MKTHILLLGFAIAILALGAFIAYTTGRYEAILYALVGALMCGVLAVFFRKNKLAAVFVPREPEEDR
jgi:uncharacterized membrane protein